MSNDDSFNDCDEVFSLYSSKKVTDTFKAQLKKIAANHELNKPLTNINEIDIKQGENINQKVTSASKRTVQPILLIEDDTPSSPIEVNGSISEDSIEIVSELPTRSTRRSERLKKKNYSFHQSSNSGTEVQVNKLPTRSSRKELNRTKKQKIIVEEVTLDDSSQQVENDDELNPEITVKVIWKSVNIKKFQVRKFQKLSYIFEQLSKEENIPEDKIILTFNNVRVNRSDTPDTLNLQVYHFLDGGVLSELSNLCHTPNAHKSVCDSDSVMLKFQGANKNIIKINLNKNEKLKVGMIKCSEQLEIPLDKIKFFFDGDIIESHETPASLGLENEEIIDFRIFT